MSRRLSRGRSTPAIRAMFSPLLALALTLLVARVRADHQDPPATTDHAAPVAHLLHRRPDLHAITPASSLALLARVLARLLGARLLGSLVPVHHTASGEVVRRQLHLHPVTGKDPDVVHPHLPRD